ncbi:MAG: S8 family serine peptidase [Acidobacteriota bacterium]|nr:S8 family serine peptidase [Acidobacteriota bacterium]
MIFTRRFAYSHEHLDPETEDLLWQLSTLCSRPSLRACESPVDDDLIERYRRGELPAGERHRFERRLAADERAMERLAGVVEKPAVRRRPALRLAASILLGALAMTGLFYTLRTGGGETALSGAEIPAYAVTVQGLAERRGSEPEASHEIMPGSRVRIVAQPATTPAPGIEFALYRRAESGTLVRIPEAAARIRVERGTAVLEAEAGDLVGPEPGLYELVMLIWPPGGLEAPASITRSELEKLALAHHLQLHSFELRLLPADGGGRAVEGSGTQATRGTDLSWEFYAAECPDAVSLFSASCGSYGELHFKVASSNCLPFDSGSGQPFTYPGYEIGASREGSTPRPLALEKLPGKAPAAGTWAALIDWQDSHGLAVGAVTEALSGPEIPAIGYYLDDDSLAPLGTEIGDQHLLVKLCQVAEDVDGGSAALTTLGMSLGRVQQPTDPIPGSPCQGTLSCHIRGLLAHLRDRDVTIAAAAGNHRELLFPAALQETLAVGALDVGGYLNSGALHRTWESPVQYDAILPGHGLCAAGTALPSGSSLATAFLTGGLARLLSELPGIDPYAGGAWVTRWSAANDCMVLAQGAQEHPYCNPEIDAVLRGVVQGVQSGCWDEADPALVVVAPPVAGPVPEPRVAGLVQWVADQLTAAPEEDPCIPCSDDDAYPPLADDLFLNLTRSMPLSESIYLDALFFRAGASFYRVDLTPQQLDSFARGKLDGLVLPGFASVLESGRHPSLFYLLKMDPTAGCLDGSQSSDCFWSSTYVLP